MSDAALATLRMKQTVYLTEGSKIIPPLMIVEIRTGVEPWSLR